MRHRRVWLEIGIIVVGIALVAAWMRPKIEEPIATSIATPTATPTPSPKQARINLQGLRLLGKNAKGFEEYENRKDGTVLIKIPGSTFTMGSNERDEEKPPHSVTLPAYLIARMPVTNAQFARFVSAAGHAPVDDSLRSSWKENASKWSDQAPVVEVSEADARAYCAWAGLRLPTEEEWELATRGMDSRVYPWGNTWDASRCRNRVGSNSPGGPAPVGSYPSGASPYGCLDMAGNVWQWTSSECALYPGNTTNNVFGQQPPVISGGPALVLRGGSWRTDSRTVLRGAFREALLHGMTFDDVGFRCAAMSL